MLGLEMLDSILISLYYLPFYMFVAYISVRLITTLFALESIQNLAFIILTIEQKIASKTNYVEFDIIIHPLSRRDSWNI